MISRDGACKSLWQDSVSSYKSTSDDFENIVFDVAIVGGGVTGITLGLLLQKAGKKCIVIEAKNLCYGTTGGTTAHLNTLLDNPYTNIIRDFGKEGAQIVANASREAIDLVKSHIQEYSINCEFENASAYLFSQNEKQTSELKDIHDACKEVGVASTFINSIPIPVPFEKSIEVARQGKFNPVQYVYALASVFEAAGGVIVEQCRVTDAHEDDTISIATTLYKIKSKALVYATHIPPGINLLHLRCSPYRSYAMAVKLKDENYPDGLIYDMYDPYHYYRTQVVNGEKFLIVGGEDHKTGENPNTNKNFLQLESHIRTYFQVAEVSYRWSSQYFEPADGLPYIGRLPGARDNVYVATGYGGNGITYSHVAALELRDLILNKQSRYNELFRPSRIKPIAGFTGFVKHNTDVVAQFIGKWFATEKLEEVSSLAPDEGKVVKLSTETMALYKDGTGGLHAVNPACTHMKCSVVWNASEKSWDCPCHGSRFSMKGEVLTGPADVDLELIELRSLLEKDD